MMLQLQQRLSIASYLKAEAAKEHRVVFEPHHQLWQVSTGGLWLAVSQQPDLVFALLLGSTVATSMPQWLPFIPGICNGMYC